MLAKFLFSSDDFEKTLRRRRMFAFGMLAVGITGLVCFILFVQGNEAIPEFIQGFYMGAATGISLGAVVLLVRTTYLLSHPEALKKARIRETDEREKQIVNESFRLAGIITFFTTAAALFVVLPFSFWAFQALLCVMAFYAVVFLVLNLVLSKRL
ncbi:MAG: hypothetical protein K2F83_07775 [Oscillospiraceae bacterium]|nr:hypothetical protein [Oscillospiraceae bacterium]